MFHLQGQPESAANREPLREPAPAEAASDTTAGEPQPSRTATNGHSRVGAPLVDILTSRDALSGAGTTESPAGARGHRRLIPVVLSLFIPGLGQAYRRRPRAAVVFLLLAAALWTVSVGWVVHLAAAVEAYLHERRG